MNYLKDRRDIAVVAYLTADFVSIVGRDFDIGHCIGDYLMNYWAADRLEEKV